MSDSAWLAIPDDDLVTGEAVALELPTATIAVRALSGLIDVVLQAVLLFGAVLLAALMTSASDDALFAAANLVAFIGILVGLPTAIETFTRGRSLGKLVLGLRTVRDDGGPISFRHALGRALVGVVEVWALTGVPALVSGLVTQRCKRLGDFVAGTHVVRDRFRLELVHPPLMPPHLAPWAAGADLAALPADLTVAARQFLRRAQDLDPARRDSLGRSLATQVSAYVAPAPPYDTHQEYFLAAVLAERRQRDAVRLSEQRRLRERLHSSLRQS